MITTLPTGLIWLLRTSFRRSYPKHTLRLEATLSVNLFYLNIELKKFCIFIKLQLQIITTSNINYSEYYKGTLLVSMIYVRTLNWIPTQLMIPRLGPTINPVAVYEPGTSVSRPQTRMALIETMLLVLFLTVVSHDGDNTVLV
ncbi:hypothetical protein AB4K20DRAFT_1868787 [Rhizopus microsporus]